MSTAIDAAFDEWVKQELVMQSRFRTQLERLIAEVAFAAGVSHAAKANTELIKEEKKR